MANNAATALAGLPREALLGQQCFSVFKGRAGSCDGCPGTEALSSGKAAEGESSALSGSDAACASSYPVSHAREIGRAMVCRLKQRGANGRARQAARVVSPGDVEHLKANFVAMVSHELRAPLAVLKGFVEMLVAGKAGRLKPLQADFVGSIKTSTDILIKLVDDILDLARWDAGQLRVERETIEVGEMVGRVEQQFRLYAAEAGVVLRNRLRAELPLLHGDRRRLEQVMMNLVSNAVKFTPPGGEVAIDAQLRANDVVITVSDTGIGIPSAEQERIFDRFYQVEGGSRRSVGSGLGLAIAKYIVDQHGGTIWVESSADAGSRFSFSVPLSRSDIPVR